MPAHGGVETSLDPAGTSACATTMLAAVYRGKQQVNIEPVPIPSIGSGEILIRVEACGICHTDLKKIEYGLLEPPRIFGHETAGVVASAGKGVARFKIGDRVIVFHHIPCENCYYCQRKLFAQCPVYKKVGVTAGFEPAGGGFSQYVRVMDWIVEKGIEIIPNGVSFEVACFVEPVNTCLKGVVQAAPQPDDLCVVMGQGPIGMLFTMILKQRGFHTVTTDTMEQRRALSVEFGAEHSWDPRTTDVANEVRKMTGGRGADVVIVAASAEGIVEQAVRSSRPGSKILLFAQTSEKERIEMSGKDICMDERIVFGSYSASVELQNESARLVFSGALPVERLVSHRVALNEISRGIELALHPIDGSLKIVVKPQEF